MALGLASCGLFGDDASLRGDTCADVPLGEWISLGMAEVPVSAVHLDVMNPGIILASTGRHEVDGELVNGALWRSTDCGRTFTRINDRMGGVTRFHQSRTQPNWVYAVNGGFWRSFDRGRSFELMELPQLPSGNWYEAMNIALNPRAPGHLVAALEVKHVWTIPTTGIRTEWAASANSGEDWTHSVDDSGMPSPMQGIRIPVFKPDDPSILFAVFHTSRIHRSFDGGATWSAYMPNLPTGSHVNGIALLPGNGIRVAISSSGNGIRYSSDGGETWRNLTGGGFEADHAMYNIRHVPELDRLMGYSLHRLVSCDPVAETCEPFDLDIPMPPPGQYRQLGVDVGVSETRWYAVARADGIRLRAWPR